VVLGRHPHGADEEYDAASTATWCGEVGVDAPVEQPVAASAPAASNILIRTNSNYALKLRAFIDGRRA
jgi:hypothetical protein